MEKRDNPHAKGLSVNEDILIDSWEDESGIHIEVDLSPAVNRLNHELDHWLRMRCSVNPIIDMKRVASFFPSVLKETVSWYYSQLPHFNRVIPIMELDGSGLALTNPEE